MGQILPAVRTEEYRENLVLLSYSSFMGEEMMFWISSSSCRHRYSPLRATSLPNSCRKNFRNSSVKGEWWEFCGIRVEFGLSYCQASNEMPSKAPRQPGEPLKSTGCQDLLTGC